MDDERPAPGEENSPQGGAFVAGLLTGALVGAALAMLLAPAAAADRARDVTTDVNERASEFYDRGKKLIEEARQGLDEPSSST